MKDQLLKQDCSIKKKELLYSNKYIINTEYKLIADKNNILMNIHCTVVLKRI